MIKWWIVEFSQKVFFFSKNTLINCWNDSTTVLKQDLYFSVTFCLKLLTNWVLKYQRSSYFFAYQIIKLKSCVLFLCYNKRIFENVYIITRVLNESRNRWPSVKSRVENAWWWRAAPSLSASRSWRTSCSCPWACEKPSRPRTIPETWAKTFDTRG